MFAPCPSLPAATTVTIPFDTRFAVALSTEATVDEKPRLIDATTMWYASALL